MPKRLSFLADFGVDFAQLWGGEATLNAGRQSREDLLRENAVLHNRLRQIGTSRLSSNLTALAKHAITYGFSGVTIVYVIRALAGQNTNANIALDLGNSVADAIKTLLPGWISIIVMIVLMAVVLRSNYRFRRINKDLVLQLSEKTLALENAADKNRTSSHLGHDGDTHARDKV